MDIKKISKFQQPEHSPGYLLWRVSLQWRNYVEQALKPYKLTHPQFVVLAVTAWLLQTEDEVSQIKIGRLSGFDPNTTSHILRGLEKRQLLTRASMRDARSKQPELTQQGMALLKEVLPAVEGADHKFFHAFGVGEEQQFVTLLRKLAEL